MAFLRKPSKASASNTKQLNHGHVSTPCAAHLWLSPGKMYCNSCDRVKFSTDNDDDADFKGGLAGRLMDDWQS